MKNTIRLFFACLLSGFLLVGCGGGADDAVLNTPEGLLLGTVCQTTSGHSDGDTFWCTTSTESFKVRLSAVDAPESSQSYAEASRQALVQLTPAGTLVSCYKTDAYGRRICRVYTPDQFDVQALMLRQGMAWHYTAYAYEQTHDEYDTYYAMTTEAQLARRGLWAQSDPQAPWECRSIGLCR